MIVGTLVDVGRGRFGSDIIERALGGSGEALHFPVAPAHGLYLVSVRYEDLEWP